MEAAASVVGIVSFGLGLAKSLQTFVETVIEAEETIVLIVAEVHATASTLKRLQDFIEQDKAASKEQQRATVFNDTGLKEIGACASQCQKIYVQIIILIEKASIQNGDDGSKDKGPQTSAADDPNAAAVRLAVFSKNVTKLGRKMRWPWLEPRIKRCQEHLGRLKVSLMLSLQVFLIAESRSRTLVAWVSKTDDEDELRDRAEALRKRIAELRARQNQQHPPKPRPPGFGDGIREASTTSSITSEPSIVSGDSGDTSSSSESINNDYSYASSPSQGSDRPRRRRRSRRSRAVKALRAFKAYVRKRTERRSVFRKDSTSTIFEAYLIHPLITQSLGPPPARGATTPFTPPMKLPFGHRRLSREIKRILRKCDPWDLLLRLGPAHRDMFNQVVQRIQANSNNMTYCLVAIDIDGYSDAEINKIETLSLFWKRMVLFFRLEPVYPEEDAAEHWGRVTSRPSRLTSTLGDVFESSLRTNMKRKKAQARIQRENDEKEKEDAKNKADREILERDKAEMEENKKALEVEKDRIREEKEDLEAEKTRIAEQKESVESRNRALRNAEKAVLENIRRGTAEKELEKIFEEERARKMVEEERAAKMMKQELSHRRYEEEHAKKAASERAAAEKAAMEEERVAAEKARPPVKFKDAVGRKFTFPFHLVQTWQGMEDLVKQAFQHVEVLGPQVQEGHYDLVDSEEEFILPSAWAETIKPGSSITMRMWPMDKLPPPPTQYGQHINPQRRTHFGMYERERASAAAPHAGYPHDQGGASGTWNSPDAWAPASGNIPPLRRPAGYPGLGLPHGGAPPRPPVFPMPKPSMVDIVEVRPPKQRKGKEKKKKPTFFGETLRRIQKSIGPKNSVHTDPLVDPQAGKPTKHGEGKHTEEIYNDELAGDIDKELGLDDLGVPQEMASKDLDDLLAAWTNPVQD